MEIFGGFFHEQDGAPLGESHVTLVHEDLQLHSLGGFDSHTRVVKSIVIGYRVM